MDKSRGFRKFFYFAIALVGILLLFWQIHIYRQTIIRFGVPFFIIAVVGVVVFIIDKDNYKNTYSISGFFIPFVQSIISWGFIGCFLFMAVNYYLGDKKNLLEYKLPIKDRSSIIGPKGNREFRKPVATIDYFGTEKELIFAYTETKDVNSADSVKIITGEGFFGFDIIYEYYVIPKKN